jgi:hypothetical protein
MHKVVMKRFLLTLALSLVALAGPVLAQEAPTLESLEVSLWPEYDRPEVLVIYRGQLDAEVALPAPVEIAIPARVGQPTAVAYVDETGQTLNQQYTTRVEGDSLIVAFELGARGFQLEYYDALPIDASGRRTYTFVYTADYPTTVLNLEVQEPPTAENFVLDPPADDSVQGTNNLVYHLVQAGAIAEGDTREWTFSYVKDNSDLTAAGLSQPEASVPTASVPAATDGLGNSTSWIFLVAFVALVGVGVTGYWLGHRTQTASQAVQSSPRRQKRRGSGRGDQAQRKPAAGEARFCHQCGAGLRSDSVFCHQCGASVRSE